MEELEDGELRCVEDAESGSTNYFLLIYSPWDFLYTQTPRIMMLPNSLLLHGNYKIFFFFPGVDFKNSV